MLCEANQALWSLSLSRARVRSAALITTWRGSSAQDMFPLKRLMAFGLILYKSRNTESGACKCQVEVETRKCAFMKQHQTFPQALSRIEQPGVTDVEIRIASTQLFIFFC